MTWKCKICGMENPDSEEWCGKCNASKQQNDLPTTPSDQVVFDSQGTVHQETQSYNNEIDFSGNIFDENQIPIDSADVTLKPISGKDTTVNTSSDSQGSFKVRVASGEYQLHIEKNGYETYKTTISIKEGITSQTIILKQGQIEKPTLPSGGESLTPPVTGARVKITIINNPVPDYTGQVFQFNIEEVFNEISLGRLPSNLITLPDGEVSRHHAKIVNENGVISLQDLGSTNKTWVFNEQTRKYEETSKIEIKKATLVKLGNRTVLRIEIV